MHHRLTWPRLIGCLAIALLPFLARAEDPLPDVKRLETSPVLRHLRPNPVVGPQDRAGAETLSRMYVPPGFRVELIAAEPEVRQPIAFAIDERGRLWVAEAFCYPQKRPAGEGLDRILIFEDADGDGRFETRKVFVERLNLVSGLEVGHGGVWVGAAPELLFIPDRNHDDVPDGPPEVLLDGFGYQDTHECLNSFLWGPDGWLYGIQGVFNLARIGRPGAPDSAREELRAGVWRYHPVRRTFEVFAHGGSNPWGLDYDERGQLFMTHCRSYWGRGLTTHVIPGGVFWNQANANYPAFIVADPPADYPGYRNYLLASARYDHGAGGAGKPGSDLIYGGHSHVGTMIYLGDNWPEEYRGHLFTHNLHGHQINHQVNRRLGSGFDTVHAGLDQLFCSDPKYVAVDLQYGPDGAVYIIDWYDQQHCHNPNTERWERGSGRIYRLQHEAGYRPARVDLGKLSDLELVDLHGHRNEWQVRTARRLLHERAGSRRIDADARRRLVRMAEKDPDAFRRLRAFWTLHLVDPGWVDTAVDALKDREEYLRAWAVRLLAEESVLSRTTLRAFNEMAQKDASAVVRLDLAAAVPRLPESSAWAVIEALSRHGEDRSDRNLPFLVWQVMARRMPGSLDRALQVAKGAAIPELADWVYWYAAAVGGDGLDRAVAGLASVDGEDRRRRLAGLVLAVESQATVPMPASWPAVAAALQGGGDVRMQRQGERVAAVFGDASRFPALRASLADRAAEEGLRRHAFAVLSRGPDRGSLTVFLGLLDDPAFRSRVIPLLARFDAPEVPPALISRFAGFPAEARAAALGALASRPAYAVALLDAVASGAVARDQLTAFHVRQLTQLKHAEVDRRVAAVWGRFGSSSKEKEAQIGKLEAIFNEAPLWAYDGRAGGGHFKKLCASCHQLQGEGRRLGPELTGAGRNGVRYYLENIIDPNAVIGTDYQMTTVETTSGEVTSGILAGETSGTVTLRTATEDVVIPKSEIARRVTSESSLMPEGLIDSLNDREQIELLKFLTTH